MKKVLAVLVVLVVLSLNGNTQTTSLTGTITTYTGTGIRYDGCTLFSLCSANFGYSGDGGPAAEAQLRSANGIALDLAGNLYIADTFDQRIRKVAPDGIITTVAGNGTQGFSGDGGPATEASFHSPERAVVDVSGNLYIMDSDNRRVRKVSTDGIITTIAGNGTESTDRLGMLQTRIVVVNPASIPITVRLRLTSVDGVEQKEFSRALQPGEQWAPAEELLPMGLDDGFEGVLNADTENNAAFAVTGVREWTIANHLSLITFMPPFPSPGAGQFTLAQVLAGAGYSSAVIVEDDPGRHVKIQFQTNGSEPLRLPTTFRF